MLKYALLCGLLALNLSGALAESDMICRLTDAPSQCGAFCLSTLAPVYNKLGIPNNLANCSELSKANEVLVRQNTMDSQLNALQNKLASNEVALTSLQDKLASIEVALNSSLDRKLDNNEQNFTKQLNGLESKLSDLGAKLLKHDGFQRIGSKYYYIEGKTQERWHFAATTCYAKQSDLAYIKDAADLAAITSNVLRNTYYWLGISDLANENQFLSLSTGKPASFFNWSPWKKDSTDVNNPNCVCLYNGKIDVKECINDFLFICQAENP
ncbi:accessory gland protein Acp29AB [Drosophila teissieri]|uniref:accessory gland protein Acp29AB n=1 Tax=Drosophila teissieri TaxID=7243 RepID=UPI001CBA2956|nr:accessory gland protein Acp29AB [Drosophila teissieri]